jgi:hypothetical protein
MNYQKQTQSNPILKGADSVELAEQRGQQTHLTDRRKSQLRNVTSPEASGYANAGLRQEIWHDICGYREKVWF